jgi:cytochrome P450
VLLVVAVNPAPVRLPPLDSDPPLHAEFRQVLNPYLSRNYLLTKENEVWDLAAETIDGWIDDGRCEFVEVFAIPFSSGVLSRLVLDESDPEQTSGVEIINRIAKEHSPEAMFDMAMLCANYLIRRENDDRPREDLLGALLDARVEGRPLTDDERLGVITVLFLVVWIPLALPSATSWSSWWQILRSRADCETRPGCAMT